MDLISELVIDLYEACMYKEGESHKDVIMIKSVSRTHGLDPKRIKENEKGIQELQYQASKQFIDIGILELLNVLVEARDKIKRE